MGRVKNRSQNVPTGSDYNAVTARKKPEHPESDFQKSLIVFFDSVVRPDEAFLFAVPNGEKRDARTAAILKAHGVRAGVSDLVLVVPGSTWYIELKKPGLPLPLDRHLSANQERFRDRIVSLRHNYRICNSIEQFIAILQEAGVAKRVTISPVGVPIVSVDTPPAYIPNFARNSAP